MELHLKFNIKPVPWSRPRLAKSGHFFTKKEDAIYRRSLQYLCKEQYQGGAFCDAVKIKIEFVMKRPKTVTRKNMTTKPDLSNLIKNVEDALFCSDSYLLVDDAKIIGIEATKAYGDSDYINLFIMSV